MASSRAPTRTRLGLGLGLGLGLAHPHPNLNPNPNTNQAYLRELPEDLWGEVRPHLEHLLQNGELLQSGELNGALAPAELLQARV